MVFSVLPGADEGEKATAPDMVANQVASDIIKEASTDAPLDPRGRAGVLFSEGDSLVFPTAGEEDTPSDPSEGHVFDSPGDDIGKDL